MISAASKRILARLGAGVSRHSGKNRAALSIASSASSVLAIRTRPTISFGLAGLTD